ncbi:MAG: hypothetical protein IT493_07220 [Gammaproteobacteria bacterium]|nr:hypothetical protein [Gammaproteobacteria bacterium]
MLQALRRPEIPGVCQEVERSSKCFVEAAQRSAAVGDFLADLDLPFFELADAVFVSRDDRWQLCLCDPVEELFDVVLDLHQLGFQAASRSFCRRKTVVPEVFERRPCDAEQRRCRSQLMEQRLELALDGRAADGLAAALAAPLGAEIVRIA